MKVVCAPDSFKESMTASEAARAMARGVRRVVPDADVVEIPLSDGGEGFLDALSIALGAERVTVDVPDALGRTSTADLGIAGDLAIIEVAQAVGLEAIRPEDRAVVDSSTAGVGVLIRAALNAGVRRIIVGLGGSATNDGGAGMLAELGVRYVDATGQTVTPTPAGLEHVASIDSSGLDPRLTDVTVEAACDVTNPLCGPRGASAVFGPQKGASPEDVERLDALLHRLAALDNGEAVAERPGAGAAGGLGYALMRHLGATMRPGIDLVTDTVGLADAISGADLVLTGEGSVDAQTLDGKTPAGVAAIARTAGMPCVVLAGRVAADADVLLDAGVTALVPILPQVMDLATALRQGPESLERATATTLRLARLPMPH